MRIAVLGSSDSWYLRDLERAAAGRHEIVPASFRELRASVGFGGQQSVESPVADTVASGGVPLAEMDAVLIRTMPAGSLEQVVFRMDALARLEAAGVLVLNPPKAVEAAVDKFLTTARLAAAGLPVPRTITCQTAADAVAAFHALGRDVVLKPLFGAEGRGLVRATDEGFCERTCQLWAQLGAVLYLQEFVPHPGHDLRALVIGDRILGMRRTNPHDWRTNISRGAVGESAELTSAERDLALRSAAAIGAPLAGVDLLTGHDGRTLVLEVNAVPGWQGLSRATGVDVASLLLACLTQRREDAKARSAAD